MNYSKVICQSCNKSFQVMTWKLGQGRGKTCSKECRHKFQKTAISGSKNHLWKGGFYFNDQGYKFIKAPDHPFANAVGYVREHRLVMEKHLRRFLKPEEVIHHINEVTSDNMIENLKLLSGNPEHRREHSKTKK